MTENEAIEKTKRTMNNKSHNKEFCLLCIEVLEEIQSYRTIGTVEEFKALKEKFTPKKPNRCLGFLGVNFCMSYLWKKATNNV